jgi:hypothetical protein
MFVASAEITEKMLQLCEHRWRTVAGLEEREYAAFRRMHVVEPQHARTAAIGLRPSACGRQRR